MSTLAYSTVLKHSSARRGEPILPPPGVSPLLHILRTANAYYASVAAAMRASQRPKHHARKRAMELQLTLNVERARACDPTWVSHIPLPILERNEQEEKERLRAAQIPPQMPRQTRAATTYARVCAGAAGKAKKPALQVVVPGRPGRPSLRLLLTAPDAQAPDVCSTPALSAGSEGSEGSTGPSPRDSVRVPLKISIKRKPSPSSQDDAGSFAEKRPKYGRKQWARGYSHRA